MLVKNKLKMLEDKMKSKCLSHEHHSHPTINNLLLNSAVIFLSVCNVCVCLNINCLIVFLLLEKKS